MAAEKSSAMTKLTDITECCICLKTFTDPRMLPCIHTFCVQCLKDLANKSNKEPRDALPCPVCREEFIIPHDGVQGIQKNFFMTRLIEVRNALDQSKIAGFSCDICKANNPMGKIPEASNQCLVCQENLCESCCKMHKSFKVSKNHDILKIGGNVGDEEAVRNMQTMNCDIHCGKILEYYCLSCKKVACASCAIEIHKTHECTDLKTVDEEFRQIIWSSARVISALADELLQKKKKWESKEDFIEKMAEREEEILQRSRELKKMIDEHTKALLSSLVEQKNRHLKEIQTDEEELDRRFVLMESFSSYCNELSLKGSDSDICRSKDELLKRADELKEDHMLYITERRVPYDVTFQATDLDNFLKTTNIVGSINEIENVKDLENFAIVIGRTDNACWNSDSYKVSLRGHSEILSRIQDVPTAVKSIPAAAVYNNTMFITGLGEFLNEIWKYNLASGWTKCGSLIQDRQDHCAEFIGETLYICGGRCRGTYFVLHSIEAYNVTIGDTVVVGQLKFGSQRAASVVYKDSVYLFGGVGKDVVPLNCVQVFSPTGNTCTILLTSIPFCCVSMQALLWETYAILVGSRTCFIFDLEGKTWQERQQFKADAVFFGMVLETERIFIIGGLYMNYLPRSLGLYEDLDNVKYVRASSIVNNEATKWKTYCKLPKPIGVAAFAKLSLIK